MGTEPVEHFGLRWASTNANGAGAVCLEADRLALPDSPDWLEEPGGPAVSTGRGVGEAIGGGQ